MLTGREIAGIVVGSVVIFLVSSLISLALVFSIVIPKLKKYLLKSVSGIGGVPEKTNGELLGTVSPVYVELGEGEGNKPRSHDEDPDPNPLPNPPPNPPPPPKTKLAHPNTEPGYEGFSESFFEVTSLIKIKDSNIKELKTKIEDCKRRIPYTKGYLEEVPKDLIDSMKKAKEDTFNGSNGSKIDSQKAFNKRRKQNFKYLNNFFKFVEEKYQVKIDLSGFEEGNKDSVQDVVNNVFRGMMLAWKEYIISIVNGEDIEDKLKDEKYRDCLSIEYFEKKVIESLQAKGIDIRSKGGISLIGVFRENMKDIETIFKDGEGELSPGGEKFFLGEGVKDYGNSNFQGIISFCYGERKSLWSTLGIFKMYLSQYSSYELSLKKSSEELPKEEAERAKLEEYKVKLDAYEAQLWS